MPSRSPPFLVWDALKCFHVSLVTRTPPPHQFSSSYPRTLGLMGNVVLTPLCGSKTMLFCPEGPSSPGRATENQPGRSFSSWTCEPSVRFQPQFQPQFQIQFQIQEGEKDAASCSSSQPEADPSPQPAVQPVALLFLGAYARCVSSPFPEFPSFGGRKMLFRCTSPLTAPTRPWELTMSFEPLFSS